VLSKVGGQSGRAVFRANTLQSRVQAKASLFSLTCLFARPSHDSISAAAVSPPRPSLAARTHCTLSSRDTNFAIIEGVLLNFTHLLLKIGYPLTQFLILVCQFGVLGFPNFIF
ncbi:hypothetical protein J6590_102795, partial [Homalodisca vitripennis]